VSSQGFAQGARCSSSGGCPLVRGFHPRFGQATDGEIFDATLRLSDTQLTIAREAGFSNWPRLKRHIDRPTLAARLNLPHLERIEDRTFRRAVDLLDAGDISGLRTHLGQHPSLAKQRVLFEGGNYFRNPSLLEFVAENPIRHGRLPKNIVAVASVILDAGVEASTLDEALMLVATGSVPRQCGVQHALIELLCDQGADPNRAVQPAALHGEMDAVRALISRGARVTSPIAAALGQYDRARRLLASSDSHDRHLALALAALYGQTEIVRLLLDSGKDPDRYNPRGGHSHSTPLHEAAGAGHEAVVALLVERGARLDLIDVLWHGTPAGWARHAGHTKLAAYLERQQQSRTRTSQNPA
jgi:Ankyrin repeats (3 copies)